MEQEEKKIGETLRSRKGEWHLEGAINSIGQRPDSVEGRGGCYR